jgi:hypothetical protein
MNFKNRADFLVQERKNYFEEINLYTNLENDITVGRFRLKSPIFYDSHGFIAGRLQHLRNGNWQNKCFSEFSNETAAACCESLNFSD